MKCVVKEKRTDKKTPAQFPGLYKFIKDGEDKDAVVLFYSPTSGVYLSGTHLGKYATNFFPAYDADCWVRLDDDDTVTLSNGN